MKTRRAIRQALVATPARRWVQPEPRFVIVGTGRSGTQYIADALTAAGIKTGHEDWWNPVGTKVSRLVGDASWCATFTLDDYRGQVFHQVRDPMKVVESMAAFGVAPHRMDRTWPKYRRNWVDLTGDPIVDAMTVVDTWLTEAERRSQWTWRVEDVNADLIVELSQRIGKRVSQARAEAALTDLSRTTNRQSQKRDGTVQIRWHDLPKGELKDRLLLHAEKYGYA